MKLRYECEECGASGYSPDNFHNDDSGCLCMVCWDDWQKQSALEAGIPLSVIEGRTKLGDHFSEGYINFKCNRKGDSDE